MRSLKMKTRSLNYEAGDPKAREDGRKAQEQKPDKSEGDGDVGLNAERAPGRTRVRPFQNPRQRRSRRVRREQEVREHLVMAEVEPDL